MPEPSVSTVISLDRVEPIVGFRQWVVVADEMVSPLARTTWDDEPMQAQCLAHCRRAGGLWRRPTPHDGPAPDPECVCGIYALFTPEGTRRRERLSRVAGAVVMWGRIEIHEVGMRAEFARIVALALPGGRHRGPDLMVGRIAHNLGVQAVPVGLLERAALVFGQAVPEVLVPG